MVYFKVSLGFKHKYKVNRKTRLIKTFNFQNCSAYKNLELYTVMAIESKEN